MTDIVGANVLIYPLTGTRAMDPLPASHTSQITTMAAQVLYSSPKILAEYLQRWGSLLHDFGFVLRLEDSLN